MLSEQTIETIRGMLTVSRRLIANDTWFHGATEKKKLLAAIDKALAELAALQQPAMPVALDMPDGPGWWAFEGSKWESSPIYVIDGVEYSEWQEEWTDEAEEYWYRNELPLIEPDHYVDVKGESFRDVFFVRRTNEGEQVHFRKSVGPYHGEPVLGFRFHRASCSQALWTPDCLTGKWYRLTMPWELQRRPDTEPTP